MCCALSIARTSTEALPLLGCEWKSELACALLFYVAIAIWQCQPCSV